MQEIGRWCAEPQEDRNCGAVRSRRETGACTPFIPASRPSSWPSACSVSPSAPPGPSSLPGRRRFGARPWPVPRLSRPHRHRTTLRSPTSSRLEFWSRFAPSQRRRGRRRRGPGETDESPRPRIWKRSNVRWISRPNVVETPIGMSAARNRRAPAAWFAAPRPTPGSSPTVSLAATVGPTTVRRSRRYRPLRRLEPPLRLPLRHPRRQRLRRQPRPGLPFPRPLRRPRRSRLRSRRGRPPVQCSAAAPRATGTAAGARLATRRAFAISTSARDDRSPATRPTAAVPLPVGTV